VALERKGPAQVAHTFTKTRAADGKNEPHAKKARVTYSQRTRRPLRITSPESFASSTDTTPPRKRQCISRRPKTPGSMLIPTPIIRKIRSPELSPCLSTAIADKSVKGSNNELVTNELRTLFGKPVLQPAQHQDAKGLLQALDSLFRHSALKGPRSGKKSLLAMCMRRAPALVRYLEEAEDEEAERLGERSTLDAPNVSFEFYNQLEAFPGLGISCKPLAEMVRSHAVLLAREAIEGGLINLPLATAMVNLASHWQCFDAAAGLLESILVACLGNRLCQTTMDDGQLGELVQFMENFSTRQKQGNMVFDILARLIQDGQVSAEWLLRQEFLLLWKAMVRAFAIDTTCPGATAFATASLLATSKLSRKPQPPTATDETPTNSPPVQLLTQVLAALAAIGYLTEEQAKRSRILHVLEQLPTGCRGKAPSLAKTSATHLPIVAAAIASKGASSAGSTLLSASQASDKQYQAIVSLVSGTARLCGRDSMKPSHSYLTAICNTLPSVRLAGRSMDQVKLDSAFLLAHKTSDLRDLSFAESLPDRNNTRNAASRAHECGTTSIASPATTGSAMFSGYRWDEGISEWVVRTPAPAAGAAGRRPATPPSSATSPCTKVRVRSSRLGVRRQVEAKHGHATLRGGQQAPKGPTAGNESATSTTRGKGRRLPLLSLQANAQSPHREDEVKVVSVSKPTRKRKAVVWELGSSDDELW
jgi:hypothetical protein